MLFGRNKEEKKICPAILFNALWQKQWRIEDLSCHLLSMLFVRSNEEKKTCPAFFFNALWQMQRSKEDLSCNPLQCSLAEAKKTVLPTSSMLFGRSKEDCPANLFNALWQKQRSAPAERPCVFHVRASTVTLRCLIEKV
jgi:hypothetical protein